MTIAEIVAKIATRELLPSEILGAFCARVDSWEPQLRALLTPTLTEAQTHAERADHALKAGAQPKALTGVPYTLKDIIETAGVRTTGQSRSRATNTPTGDAAVAQRLKQADGLLIGKAATWEFAHGGPSWDILQPPARNPWDLRYDPSGSSSGSAAAIAAGLCAGSIGSDTGGSIRGPAAACGIVGLKPTPGLVSARGVIPNSYSLDCVGPMAWTTEDVAILLDVISVENEQVGFNYRQQLARPLNGVKLGVPSSWLDRELPPSNTLGAAFDEALRVFRDLGASVRTVVLPPLQRFEDAKKIIAAVELFAAHGKVLRETPELLGRSFRLRVSAGAFVSGEEYLNAQRWRRRLADDVADVFRDIDVLVLPTGEPASLLEERAPESLFAGAGYLAAFNVSGNPALATRLGFTDEKMPLSLQIVGRPFEEARVLNVAHQYENATPWARSRPAAI